MRSSLSGSGGGTTTGGLDAAQQINGISFNQDGQCFAVAMESGFRIFNTDPLRETMRREMLYRYNYLALVGGGVRLPLAPRNKVLLFDDKTGRITTSLEFRSEVLAVRLRKDRIIVVLRTKIFVYTFGPEPQGLVSFDTGDNEHGVIAVCYSESNALIAFPSQQRGHIQVADISDHRRTPTLIAAHETDIRCLAFNPEGTLLATASAKGTVIRLFDVEGETRVQVGEMRRGTETAQIYSMAFSFDSARLAVASGKGTIHIFNLHADLQPDLTNLKQLIPKYLGCRSFAHARMPTDARCQVQFGNEKNTVIVISVDGYYCKFTFDLIKGGSAIRDICVNYLLLQQ